MRDSSFTHGGDVLRRRACSAVAAMTGKVKYRITPRHLAFVDEGSRGEQCIRLELEGMNRAQIAEKLGMKTTNVSKTLRAVYEKARGAGYTPEHPEYDIYAHAIPAGHVIKGISHLQRDEDGNPIWIKTKAQAVAESGLEEFAKGLVDSITPARPRKPASGRKYRSDIMPAIFIGDAHIGMRAFGEHTKHENFDTNIATAQLKQAFEYLTDRADPAKQSLFVNVGDLIHADSAFSTTTSGTPLDTDTRHYRTMRATAQAMVYGIDLQLQKHRKVVVVMARGNHDDNTAGALQLMLEFYYQNEPRVHVLPTDGYVHYIEWHKWLIGIHHGDKMRAEKLASVMARDMAESWGRTTHRLWATGHYHKEAVKTLDGVKHKVFAALPPPDSWHASHGFAGDGEMEMLIFRKDGGIEASHVYNVPQPRVEPDVRLT